MPPEFWQMCSKHQYAHQVLQGGLARRCLLSVLGDNLSTTAGSLDEYGAVERGGQKFELAANQNPVSPQHKGLSMMLLSSRKLSGTSERGSSDTFSANHEVLSALVLRAVPSGLQVTGSQLPRGR